MTPDPDEHERSTLAQAFGSGGAGEQKDKADKGYGSDQARHGR